MATQNLLYNTKGIAVDKDVFIYTKEKVKDIKYNTEVVKCIDNILAEKPVTSPSVLQNPNFRHIEGLRMLKDKLYELFEILSERQL